MNKIVVTLVIAFGCIYNVQAKMVGILCHPTKKPNTVAKGDWQAVLLENLIVGTTADASSHSEAHVQANESCKLFRLPQSGKMSGVISAVRPGINKFPWTLERASDGTYNFYMPKIRVRAGGQDVWFPVGGPKLKEVAPGVLPRAPEITDNHDGTYTFMYRDFKVVDFL
jgi:hypothetical protein